jgi:DNA-binding GntR family transcriptional regulator
MDDFMDDLVYKKRGKGSAVASSTDTSSNSSSANFPLPSLAQLQEKQRSELIEMAQVRFGIKGIAVQINLAPLQIHLGMTQKEIFKALLDAPEAEHADQVLYALAKGEIDADMANQILASLALLDKFKKIKIES